MMAVKDATAPTDPACAPVVDRSAQALNTYESGVQFSAQFANTDGGQILGQEYCDDPYTLSNPFQVPVIYWGVTLIRRNGVIKSHQPFVTEVIPPGGSVERTLPSGEEFTDYDCLVSYEGIVAPTGKFALGIDGLPAPADDPLASDDPQVWGHALLDPDIDDWSVADVVNRIEDIHSNDVGNHASALAAGDMALRTEVRTHTICVAEPADLGPDVVGEYAWLTFTSQSSTESYHAVGLFSRGVDRRWRFIGTVQVIDQVVDPTDLCKFPPRSVG